MFTDKQDKVDKDAEKSVCSFANNRDPEVLLQTLRVTLYNGNEKMNVRLIIDSGSQKSYITREAASRIGYVPIAEQLLCHSLFGGESSGTVKHKKYVVKIGSLSSDFKCNFTALDQRVICKDVPSIKRGEWCREMKDLDISLSDLDAKEDAVAILIGADIAGKLLTGKRHILRCGLVAIETYLGWTVIGAIKDPDARHDPVPFTRTMFASCQVVESLFLARVHINKEGRYEVPLPWLENHPPLSENKMMVIKRLESTMKQLRTSGLHKAYDAVFDEWLAECIIERVPEAEVGNKGHYLPHRPIIKENSTTVIRPIFDASAAPKPTKEKKSLSLNDCLEKGPNLIELISSILLRFREGMIGVVSDIKKAFLQISLNASDRDFLRFLWQDKQGNQVIFRHCRVVFGVTSSPFILSAVLFMHLEKNLTSLDANKDLNFSEQNIV
ncbi:uncharacterized protein LOC103316068 [Nasonia vitripennis]|uniref:Peptidase aspartic putative domain-containing protein n=1 Tax=Nasonia vitripennis TaxID=7425 RepID=A0A7M7HAQ8_NASVI|nr:uncharacterized protein LOC103316068 [Nasonia vitripennis]